MKEMKLADADTAEQPKASQNGTEDLLRLLLGELKEINYKIPARE